MDTITSIVKWIIESLPSIGVGGIIGTVITTIIKNRLELKSENKRRTRDEKERQYKAFLNNLLGFFDKWKDDILQLQFMWEVYTNATVYASDEVLRLTYSYIKSLDKKNKMDDAKRQQLYAKLVITIRNELNKITGESKSDLTEDEIKIYGLNDVESNVKKQFLNSTHPKVTL